MAAHHSSSSAGVPVRETRKFAHSSTVPMTVKESWNLRALCQVGSVLPKAVAVGDVNDDGEEEIFVGTSEGSFMVLKHTFREPLFHCTTLTTVSLVLWEPSHRCLIVVCLEGTCHLLPNFTGQAEIERARFKQSAPVPSNCSAGAVVGDKLFLGSSNRRVYAFKILFDRKSPTMGRAAADGSGGGPSSSSYFVPELKQLGSFFVNSPIFSVTCFNQCGMELLLVATTSGALLVQADEATIAARWNRERIASSSSALGSSFSQQQQQSISRQLPPPASSSPVGTSPFHSQPAPSAVAAAGGDFNQEDEAKELSLWSIHLKQTRSRLAHMGTPTPTASNRFDSLLAEQKASDRASALEERRLPIAVDAYTDNDSEDKATYVAIASEDGFVGLYRFSDRTDKSLRNASAQSKSHRSGLPYNSSPHSEGAHTRHPLHHQGGGGGLHHHHSMAGSAGSNGVGGGVGTPTHHQNSGKGGAKHQGGGGGASRSGRILSSRYFPLNSGTVDVHCLWETRLDPLIQRVLVTEVRGTARRNQRQYDYGYDLNACVITSTTSGEIHLIDANFNALVCYARTEMITMERGDKAWSTLNRASKKKKSTKKKNKNTSDTTPTAAAATGAPQSPLHEGTEAGRDGHFPKVLVGDEDESENFEDDDEVLTLVCQGLDDLTEIVFPCDLLGVPSKVEFNHGLLRGSALTEQGGELATAEQASINLCLSQIFGYDQWEDMEDIEDLFELADWLFPSTGGVQQLNKKKTTVLADPHQKQKDLPSAPPGGGQEEKDSGQSAPTGESTPVTDDSPREEPTVAQQQKEEEQEEEQEDRDYYLGTRGDFLSDEDRMLDLRRSQLQKLVQLLQSGYGSEEWERLEGFLGIPRGAGSTTVGEAVSGLNNDHSGGGGDGVGLISINTQPAAMVPSSSTVATAKISRETPAQSLGASYGGGGVVPSPSLGDRLSPYRHPQQHPPSVDGDVGAYDDYDLET